MNQLTLGNELRRLSMMADRGAMGIELKLNGEPAEDLLEAGSAFCSELLTATAAELSEGVSHSQLQVNALVAALESQSQPVDTEPLKLSELRDELERVQQLLEEAKHASLDQGPATHAMKLLAELSTWLHDIDAANIQALKERRGLHAYG